MGGSEAAGVVEKREARAESGVWRKANAKDGDRYRISLYAYSSTPVRTVMHERVVQTERGVAPRHSNACNSIQCKYMGQIG